ncbi:hypothetical protein Tco_0167601 [Tanacetum coccineum]
MTRVMRRMNVKSDSEDKSSEQTEGNVIKWGHIDHAENYVDRNSTSGVCTFMGCCLTSWFSKKQTALAISTTEAEYVSAGKACQQALWMKQALIDYGVRLDDIPIMCDNKGAIDLKQALLSGNILKTRSKATPNEPSSPGTSSGGGPRCQETMGDTVAQTRYENVSKLSNDLLLARVIDLEKTKTSQAQEITSLKRRVKRLEKKGGSRTYELKRLYKIGLSGRVESSDEEGLGEEDASKHGRIADIDADAGINIVSTHFDADTNMFGVHNLVGDEVVVEREVAVKAASTIPVSAATTTTIVITNDEITLANALTELKSAKLPTTTAYTIIIVMSTRPRAKGLFIHKQEQAPTLTVSSQPPSQLNVQDKAEEKEKERLAREKAQQIEEVNIAWDDV